MKKVNEEIKLSVYAGMSIFNLLKKCKIKINNKCITEDEKKYLSLYLGIINTENVFSKYLTQKHVSFNILVNYILLEPVDYISIYNKHFIDILNDIRFFSIIEYINYLLNKDIVKEFNASNGKYVDDTIKYRNKQLIKTIK